VVKTFRDTVRKIIESVKAYRVQDGKMYSAIEVRAILDAVLKDREGEIQE
jgi:hypothetical protein